MSNNLITKLLFYAFISLSASLLFWGFNRQERLYQYPFLMGTTFSGFILPQVFSLLNHSGSIPERAIQRLLFMSCLCAVMCWIGYQIPINRSWLNQPPILINHNRLKTGATIYIGIGLIAWLLVYSLPEGRALTGIATGTITIYFFFTHLLKIGFAIILIEVFKKPSLANKLMVIIASFMPLYRTIFFGRREDCIFIILALALAIYFTRRVVVPKALSLIAIFLAALIVFNVGQYRNALSQNNWVLVKQINLIENMEAVITGKENMVVPEIRNAAILIDSTVENSRYGWGTGYWDKLVFSFVPAQILSNSFKQSLQFSLSEYSVDRDYSYKVYRHKSPGGSTSTGIADAFSQFDYLGCLVFAFMAYFFKFLWLKAIYQNSFVFQILYILMIVSPMLALTHGTTNFLPDLVYYTLFLLPILVWARIPNQSNSYIN